MAPSNSEGNARGVAVPQPIPTPASSTRREQQQSFSPPALGGQYRRNSFTGWSQSFFGMPQAARAQQQQQQQQGFPSGGESLPKGIPSYPLSRSYSLSSEVPTGASPPPSPGSASSFSSAFPGMGILRRLSVSSGAPPPPPLSSQQQQQQQQPGEFLEFHKSSNHHTQPKVPNDMQAEDDDSQNSPDSRMRNLMLSGQFLL